MSRWSVVRLLRYLPFAAWGFVAAWVLLPASPVLLIAGILVLVLVSPVLNLVTSVVCARLVSFRPLIVRLGPLAGVSTITGWRIILTVPRSLGYLIYSPDVSTEMSLRELRTQSCVLLLASPVSVAFPGVLIVAAAIVSGSLFMWLIALFAAVGVIDRLLPWPPRARARSGWYLLSWLVRLNGTAQRTALQILSLQLYLRYGARPRQFHESWIELAAGQTAASASREDAVGSRIAYACALDRGDTIRARACIERAVAWTGAIEPYQRQAALIEAAFLSARYDDDADTADRLLIEAGSVNAHLADDLARAEAAIHLSRGRFEEALASCVVALEAVPTKASPDLVLLRRVQGAGEPTGGHAAFHRDQVHQIRDAVRTRVRREKRKDKDTE